jgi:L-ascorbate metabolism protein UlaG (beta-lactamase superfamily)
MKLTKYQHACFTVEKDDQVLVVDPGGFSSDFIAPEHVVAVVITHEHGDHFDAEQLEAIIDKNPDAIVLGPEAVTSKIEAFQTKPVEPGETFTVGPFRLAFFGGKHATIHSSMTPISNVGVMVNDLLYYPGDSFVIPETAVDTLALPAAAPWMKISEAMDFLAAVRPRLAFPTHDAILSVEGKEIADRMLQQTAEQNGTSYERLEKPIEI